MRVEPPADLDRPAVVSASPVPCSGPERRFRTLREALLHAGRDEAGEAAWIVTWSGAILTPRTAEEWRRLAGSTSTRKWAGRRVCS